MYASVAALSAAAAAAGERVSEGGLPPGAKASLSMGGCCRAFPKPPHMAAACGTVHCTSTPHVVLATVLQMCSNDAECRWCARQALDAPKGGEDTEDDQEIT